ncbi:MAG: tetratricopeptide repeat protein [Verrucomicrobiota bacterium]
MRRATLIALLLAFGTLILYWPATRFEFVDYDDPAYVVQNPYVTRGLSMEGLKYAFTGRVLEYWQPLTLLSHMLDCELFGTNAAAHHSVNLLFHTVNTVLLFLLLHGMTGRLWEGAWVAALFAWHPLHVESVAWIAERKDVLSTFFWSLTIWAYWRYAEGSRFKVQGSGGRAHLGFYTLALVFFVLGLLSKSMVVTLPCLLLLLDFWPLRRWDLRLGKATESAPDATHAFVPWQRLVLEKVPFFALTAAISAITFLNQKAGGSFISSDSLPLGLRLANALVSYGRYLQLTFWPEGLAAFYPHPGFWPAWRVLICGAAVAGGCAAAAWQWRARPWLAVGWFWFFGTLVPVIGLVQAGWHSIADHFTYVPLTGIFILLAWGGAEVVRRRTDLKKPAAVAAVVVLVTCAVLTREQMQVWRNSEALFSHAIKVTKDNYIALMGMGNVLANRGQPAQAIPYLREAVRIQPYFTDALNCLGDALEAAGQRAEAKEVFQKALRITPDNAETHLGLGNVLSQEGQFEAAAEHYRKALAEKPAQLTARNNLANMLVKLGRFDEAVTHYQELLRINPNMAEAHYNLAATYSRVGRLNEAAPHYEAALKLNPNDARTHAGIGFMELRLGRVDAALTHFREWARLAPEEAEPHYRLGLVLASTGQHPEALKELRETLRIAPDHVRALTFTAHLLATSPDAALRDGATALKLADHAVNLSQGKDFLAMDALAEAHAESGRFSEAVRLARTAASLARAAGQAGIAAEIELRMKLYESGQPYRGR